MASEYHKSYVLSIFLKHFKFGESQINLIIPYTFSSSIEVHKIIKNTQSTFCH